MTIARRRLALVIEATWLLGLVLVPLVFRGREWVAIYSQPKYFLVHMAALVIVVAWTAEWALSRSQNQSISSVFDGVDRWVGREPGRWAVLAFGGFALAAKVGMTPRSISTGGSSLIGLMGFLPELRTSGFIGKRFVRDMMQPGMPLRRDSRAVYRALVQHPAFLAAMQCGFLGPVIAVAEFVGTDANAVKPSVN